MDRKTYLEMCRQVSLIPAGINNLRQVPMALWVEYDGLTLYPVSYEMRFTDGEHWDVAVMHDLRADCIVRAELEKVRTHDAE